MAKIVEIRDLESKVLLAPNGMPIAQELSHCWEEDGFEIIFQILPSHIRILRKRNVGIIPECGPD